MKNVIQKLTSWLTPILGAALFSGNTRTIRAQKNILALLGLRGISLVTGFIIVPLTLHCLTPVKYGIWLTISSTIGWFVFFDIGIGNGFRNKFAEALAHNDMELARTYLSTTYAILSIIIGIMLFCFVIVSPLTHWVSVFNAPLEMANELSFVVAITFIFFCLRFVFGIIGTVVIADQHPAYNSLLDVIGNLASLAVIWFLTVSSKGSLLNFSIGLGACNALVPIGASFILFASKYRHIRPAKRYVQFSHAKELMGLGVKFFILQISSLIVFSSANIIIAQIFSPAEVVPYNIAFKYYNIISMLFYLVLLPFWSAYTEAYARGDVAWIQRTLRVLRRLWIFCTVMVIAMSFFANTFYRLWVGKEIQIPMNISITMGLFIVMTSWCSIYGNLINGTGMIRLALLNAIAIGFANIPLAIFFAKHLHLGIPGVILASCVCLLPGCFLWPIQVKKILSGSAAGIWGK
jgi:O-antigen/teichoic acid export membrane protein